MNLQPCEKSYDFTYNQACGVFPDPTTGYSVTWVSRAPYNYGEVITHQISQEKHLEEVRFRRAVCKIVCPTVLAGVLFIIGGCLAVSHECPDDDFDDCSQTKNPNSYPDVQAMYIVAGVVGAFALSCVFNTLYPLWKYNSLHKPDALKTRLMVQTV